MSSGFTMRCSSIFLRIASMGSGWPDEGSVKSSGSGATSALEADRSERAAAASGFVKGSLVVVSFAAVSGLPEGFCGAGAGSFRVCSAAAGSPGAACAGSAVRHRAARQAKVASFISQDLDRRMARQTGMRPSIPAYEAAGAVAKPSAPWCVAAPSIFRGVHHRVVAACVETEEAH